MFVHTADFVHNIQPETIVVFRNDGSSIGAPFQMGFENFRPAVTETHISLEIRIGRKTCINILPDKGSICRRCTECNTTSTVLGFASSGTHRLLDNTM
jgi:hypothetical protein